MTISALSATGNDLAALRLLLNNGQQQITQYGQSPEIAKAADYFTRYAPQDKTLDDLLNDRRSLVVLLGAYGLSSLADSPGLVKQVLTSDLNDKSSAAYSVNSSFQQLAKDLDYKNNGLSKLQDATFLKTVTQNYVQSQFESSLTTDAGDATLTEAAYFARSIGQVTSPYQILGDATLRDVVSTVLGLPKDIAVQSVETQAAYITAKLNLSDFQTSSVSQSQLATQLQPLKNDQAIAKAGLQAVTDASDPLVAIQTRLRNIQQAYLDLPNQSGAAGVSAATLTQQQQNLPGIIQVEGLLSAAEPALSTVASSLRTLQADLSAATKAVDSTGATDTTTLAKIKAEFQTATQAAIDAINNATFTGASGPANDNLLIGNGGATVTIPGLSVSTPDQPNRTFSVTRQDLSGLISYLNNANSSFQALTTAPDIPATQAIAAQLTSASNQQSSAQTVINLARSDYEYGLSLADPYGTRQNNLDLYRAQDSIADSLRRSDSIQSDLGSLTGLINQAASSSLSASDRATLVTQFESIRQTVVSNIVKETAGQDNYLNSGQQTYTDSDGTQYNVGGLGKNTLLDQINSLSIDSLANAQTAQTGLDSFKQALTNVTTSLTLSGTKVAAAVNAQLDSTDRPLLDPITGLPANSRLVQPLDTAGIITGKTSVDSAVGRLGTISTYLDQLLAVATKASGIADGTDYSSVTGRFQNAQTAIAGLTTDSDLTSPPLTAAYNLLLGSGTESIHIASATGALSDISITASHQNLDSIFASLSGLQVDSSANAQAAIAAIKTAQASVATALTSLNNTDAVLTRSLNQFDPRGSIDHDVQSLSSSLEINLKGAPALLNSTAQPVTLTFSNQTVTLPSVASYFQQVQAAADAAVAALKPQSSVTEAQRQANVAVQLNSAVLAVTQTVSPLQGAAATLSGIQDSATKQIQDLQSASSGTTAQTYKVSDFTQKFLEKFVTLSQLNNGTAYNPDAYLLTLFSSSSDTDSNFSGIDINLVV